LVWVCSSLSKISIFTPFTLLLPFNGGGKEEGKKTFLSLDPSLAVPSA